MHCFVNDGLEIRLNGDIVADLCEKGGNDTSDFIVSKHYCYRQRDEIVNVQGMIEDTFEK